MDAPPGEMTSSSLMRLLREAVARRMTVPIDPEADKLAMLLALLDHAGPTAVIEAGGAIRTLRDHPVLAAIVLGASPVAVLQRWIRLERFGHTRNRTRLLGRQAAGRATLEHYALDGGPIHAVEDLFIWGVLVALIERAGFEDIDAGLEQPDGSEVGLWRAAAPVLADIPGSTARLNLHWSGRARPSNPGLPVGDEGPVRVELGRLFASDPLRRWSLRVAAASLGRSPRDLQRRLNEAGTTFSETLHRTRIDAACALMKDPRLSLTEIAFAVGFADQAHFSRVFHRYCDVAPNAYRGLLQS